MPDVLQDSGVIEMISECNAAGLSAEWYVFGSVISEKPLPEDIDLLCIVDSYDQQANLLSACENFLLLAPIHLRILSATDETRLNFVEKTNAVRIADILRQRRDRASVFA